MTIFLLLAHHHLFGLFKKIYLDTKKSFIALTNPKKIYQNKSVCINVVCKIVL